MKIRSPALVLGVLAALALVMIVAAAVGLRQSYLDTFDRMNVRAVTAAHGIAAQTQWMMVAIRQALSRIDDAIGSDLGISDDARAKIAAYRASIPAEVDVWIVDREGRTLFTSDREDLHMQVHERPYFQLARDQGTEFYVSPLFVRRSNDQHTFVIARRLERDGGFAGVVAFYVPAAILARNLEKLNLGQDSTVSVFRTDGELVARHPPPPGPMNLRDYVLFKDKLASEKAGSYEAISPADGVHRVVGYATVEGEILVGLASIGRQAYFAPFRGTVLKSIGALAALLLLLVLTFAWLLRVLKREDDQRRRLTQAVDDNVLLLKEIHHRVKNNLMAVSAMIQLEKLPSELKDEMQGRIQAMAAIQEQSYRQDQYGDIELSAYLSRLVANLRASSGGQVVIVENLQEMTVSRDAALPLGLIANEAITNALKHAFPDGRSGCITVTLSHNLNKGELVIEDDGVGYQKGHSASGFGSVIMTRFVQQLGGDSSTTIDNGTKFRIRFEAEP